MSLPSAPRIVLILGLACLSDPAMAEGEAPTPTTPISQCKDGEIFDADSKTCVDRLDNRFNDTERLDAARDLAAAGRATAADSVLATLSDPETADALTVRGFAARKAGDTAAGFALYARALSLDPDHWQARSYLGQGLLLAGKRADAERQLRLIRTSGGRGSWPEVSLLRALGGEFSY